MWDEAGQKVRALLASRFSSAQRIVQVMVTLAVLWESRVFDAVTKRRWEPWVCPPLFMDNTKHEALLAGLERVLPFKLTDPFGVTQACAGAILFIFCCCFDWASSNVAAFGKMTRAHQDLGEIGANLALH